MPVAADLGEPAVRVVDGDLLAGDVGDQLVDGGEPGVVGGAAADHPVGGDGRLDQRRLVGDPDQREGDLGLAVVQPVRVDDAEHRGLDVLGGLATGQQQLTDAQRQVEDARDVPGGGRVQFTGCPLEGRALGHRGTQQGAHPVGPGGVTGGARAQGGDGDAGGRDVAGGAPVLGREGVLRSGPRVGPAHLCGGGQQTLGGGRSRGERDDGAVGGRRGVAEQALGGRGVGGVHPGAGPGGAGRPASPGLLAAARSAPLRHVRSSPPLVAGPPFDLPLHLA